MAQNLQFYFRVDQIGRKGGVGYFCASCVALAQRRKYEPCQLQTPWA